MSNSNSSKQILLSVIGIAVLIIAVVGVAFAFFNYTRTGSSNVIKTGRISFNHTQGESINLTNMFPIDVTNGIPNDNTKVGEVVINVTGDTTYTEGIEYLVSAVNVTNTIANSNKTLPISIEVTVEDNGNNNPATDLGEESDDYFNDRGSSTSVYSIVAGDTIDADKDLLMGYIAKGSKGVDGNIVVKAYIDKAKVVISDTYPAENTDTNSDGYLDGTETSFGEGKTVFTTEEWNSLQANGVSFKVKVEANEGIWVENPFTGEKMVRSAILAKINAETNSCNPVWVDDNGTANDETDDITYFSGTNDCVDMNYVWYSGKLWRIIAIYPDGSMKLVTEDMITSIYWGANKEFDGSWIYQWLNEDFYDTLYNKENILLNNSIWNYSGNDSVYPVRPETIATQKVTSAPVGLLNIYEYYNSHRNGSPSSGYLNNVYFWWLITTRGESGPVCMVDSTGESDTCLAVDSEASGVRPSIVIKPGLQFIGNGILNSPYRIVGDKEEVANNTTLLSSRNIGEYVNFDNDLYRIVEISDGITKLTKVDLIRNAGEIVKKESSSSVYFGKNSNTQTDTYWDYYLNNTWYNSISDNYKNMLVDGIYYLGEYLEGHNYKNTICKDANLDSVTTKTCTKYTSNDVNKTFTGKVGLPRVGEMFSSQLGVGELFSSQLGSIGFLTLTPAESNDDGDTLNYILYDGFLEANLISSKASVRPSITLKSGIKITGGTGYVGGDVNSPFEISE